MKIENHKKNMYKTQIISLWKKTVREHFKRIKLLHMKQNDDVLCVASREVIPIVLISD